MTQEEELLSRLAQALEALEAKDAERAASELKVLESIARAHVGRLSIEGLARARALYGRCVGAAESLSGSLDAELSDAARALKAREAYARRAR